MLRENILEAPKQSLILSLIAGQRLRLCSMERIAECGSSESSEDPRVPCSPCRKPYSLYLRL